MLLHLEPELDAPKGPTAVLLHKEAAGWFLEDVVSGMLESQTGSGNYYPPASALFYY